MAATEDGASVHERLIAHLSDEPKTEDVRIEGDEAEPEPSSEEPTEIPEEESQPETVEEEAPDVPQEGETLELSELAQIVGLDESKLDVDDDGQIYVKTKIDGEEGRATLADLIKSYQLEGHLNKQNMEVAESRKVLQAKLTEIDQQKDQSLEQLENLAQAAQALIYQDYQNVDWDNLREYDREEFLTKKYEFEERGKTLQQIFQQVQTEKAKNETPERKQEQLLEEQKKLLSAIPEWQDPEVEAKGKQALREYIPTTGITDESVLSTTDHALFVTIRKAMLYDQLQKKKPAITQRVKAGPKIARPGSPGTAEDQKTVELKKAREAVKKSGGKSSAVANYLLKAGKV